MQHTFICCFPLVLLSHLATSGAVNTLVFASYFVPHLRRLDHKLSPRERDLMTDSPVVEETESQALPLGRRLNQILLWLKRLDHKLFPRERDLITDSPVVEKMIISSSLEEET